MANAGPSLPSVLSPSPALQDTATSQEQLTPGIARNTNPSETPIFICAFAQCNRLFPSRDRLMAHRKWDHESEESGDVITWNE